MARNTDISRKTNETDINLKLNIDGNGNYNINTGVGFFNHMLELFAKHGQFDLEVIAKGDINVDYHHTIEDVGIVIGNAINECLGGKKSIKRYGTSFLPMDETLVLVSLDLGGRPYLVFDADFSNAKIGEMDTELVKEFFKSISINSKMNIHIKKLHGENNHHIAEAIFKGFARALYEASRIDENIKGVMSTKGTI